MGTGPAGRITASDVENFKAGAGGVKTEKKKDEGPKIGVYLPSEIETEAETVTEKER